MRWRPTEGAPAQHWRRPRRARNGWEPDPEKLLTGDIQACESTEELAEVVRKHGPRFNFIHVAAVWKVLSRMHGPGAPPGRRLNEKLVKDVYGLTVDCAEDMDAMGVATAMHGAANLHACGRLKASPQRLAGALLQRAALVVDDFTPQGIANLMHGPVHPSRAPRAHRAHRSPRHCAQRPLLPPRCRRARRPQHAPVTGGGCPRWGCAPSPRCWARSRRARWPPPPTSSRRWPPLALSSPRLLPATLHHHPGHRPIEVLARSCDGPGGRERPHHLGDAVSPCSILFAEQDGANRLASCGTSERIDARWGDQQSVHKAINKAPPSRAPPPGSFLENPPKKNRRASRLCCARTARSDCAPGGSCSRASRRRRSQAQTASASRSLFARSPLTSPATFLALAVQRLLRPPVPTGLLIDAAPPVANPLSVPRQSLPSVLWGFAALHRAPRHELLVALDRRAAVTAHRFSPQVRAPPPRPPPLIAQTADTL